MPHKAFRLTYRVAWAIVTPALFVAGTAPADAQQNAPQFAKRKNPLFVAQAPLFDRDVPAADRPDQRDRGADAEAAERDAMTRARANRPDADRESARQSENTTRSTSLQGLDATDQPMSPDDNLNPQASQSDQPQDPKVETGDEEEEEEQAKDEIGPYDALGMRVGSFKLFPSIEVGESFTDNLFLSSRDTRGDHAFTFSPGLTFTSDWSRHELSGELRSTNSYYDRFSSENENDYSALLRGRIDVTDRTKLSGEVLHSRIREDRDSTDFPDNAAERAYITTEEAALEASHRFNRLTVSLRGSVTDESYTDVAAADGSIISGETRDNTYYETGARAAYEFRPGVSVFIDGALNERRYALATDDEGGASGSSGYEAQAGLAFELTGKLTGEAGVGYASQTPNDNGLDVVAGVTFNGSLVWAATPLTTVTLSADSSIDESASTFTRSYGIAVEHALQRNVILGGGLAYSTDEDADSGDRSHEWDATLSAEYLLNRTVGIKGAYTYTLSEGSSPDDGYTVNAGTVALTFKR